ncbi:hypothetical protein IFM89_013107 [Coptis chinensis]|uniref:Retrotransposon Copia-like N-terminal domain-containing protein n=1 Tax=Coptis chinensis TaxID=261450 RepID=A0A835IME4_9MAGN|nr:hypothetical protein IFM89_013107 [Coptis chinensis]
MWTSDMKGIFSMKSEYNEIGKKGNKEDWSQWLWEPNVPKKNATTAWKIISNAASMDSNIQKKVIHLFSRCLVCGKSAENLCHLLWNCEFTRKIWKLVASQFKLRSECRNLKEVSTSVSGRSTMIKQLWEATLIGTLLTLWKHRYLIVHEDKTCSFYLCTSMIRREVRNASLLVTGHSMNCIVDLQSLNAWNLQAMLPKAPRIKSCWWTSPAIGTIKINCDDSSLGNPGNASLGASYRTSAGDFLLGFSDRSVFVRSIIEFWMICLILVKIHLLLLVVKVPNQPPRYFHDDIGKQITSIELDGKNYLAWSQAVRVFLRAKMKHKYLIDDPPDENSPSAETWWSEIYMGDKPLNEHYALLRNLREELLIYQPITPDVETQRKQREDFQCALFLFSLNPDYAVLKD